MDHRVKSKEIEKRDKYLDLARELQNIMEHKSDGDTNNYKCSWNRPQILGDGTRRDGPTETIQDTVLEV